MTKNVGSLDRVFRIVAGLVLIALAVTDIFAPWGWIGVVPLVTGALKWCPAYSLFGFRTCPLEKGDGA